MLYDSIVRNLLSWKKNEYFDISITNKLFYIVENPNLFFFEKFSFKINSTIQIVSGNYLK